MDDQSALFGLPPGLEPVTKPRRSGWGGSASRAARAKCRAMLPAPCWRCGGIITTDMPETEWQAGHTTDRADGGSDHDVMPEHTGCNLSAGGKRGAAITNAARGRPSVPVETYRQHEPQWW